MEMAGVRTALLLLPPVPLVVLLVMAVRKLRASSGSSSSSLRSCLAVGELPVALYIGGAAAVARRSWNGIKQAISIRYSGVITQSKKLPGKRRNLFNPNVLSCSNYTKVYNFHLTFNLAPSS